MQLETLTALFPDLQQGEIIKWVERGWVQPDEGLIFKEIDVARIRLIRDLQRDLAVTEDTVPVVLALIDQLYDLRCTLRDMMEALRVQPEAVRQSVFAALKQARR